MPIGPALDRDRARVHEPLRHLVLDEGGELLSLSLWSAVMRITGKPNESFTAGSRCPCVNPHTSKDTLGHGAKTRLCPPYARCSATSSTPHSSLTSGPEYLLLLKFRSDLSTAFDVLNGIRKGLHVRGLPQYHRT